jgi:hypothetical protein
VNVEKMTGILEIKCIFSYIYEATIRKFPIASHYETERYCFRRHRDPDHSGHGCFLIYGIFIPRLIRAIPSSFLPVCVNKPTQDFVILCLKTPQQKAKQPDPSGASGRQ